jgi:hypothetical protein
MKVASPWKCEFFCEWVNEWGYVRHKIDRCFPCSAFHTLSTVPSVVCSKNN